MALLQECSPGPARPPDAESHGAGARSAILRLLASGWGRRGAGECPRLAPLVAGLADLIGIVGVSRSDRFLVVLSDAGTRNLVDERPALRQPPPNDLVGQ